LEEDATDGDKKMRGHNTKTSHPKYLELARMLGTGPKRRTGSSSRSETTTLVVGDVDGNSSNSSGNSSDLDKDSPQMEPLNLINVDRYYNNNNSYT